MSIAKLQTTPRSTRTLDAATTPHRRSQLELLEQLNSLFDSLGPTDSTSPRLLSPHDPDPPAASTPRTAPLRLLPDLLAAFEAKRGVHILDEYLRASLLQQIAALPAGMEDQPVGVEHVLQLLVGLGATSEATPAPEPAPSEVQSEPGPSLHPPTTDEGSPRPRNRRTISSSSAAPASASAAKIPLLASPSTSTPRRRSLLTTLSRSPHLSGSGPAGGRTLRRRATFEDLAAIVQAHGGTYLGLEVGATGPLGEGWSAEEQAEKVRKVMSGKGSAREKDLIALLGPLSHAQLRALDKAYATGSMHGLAQGRTLLDAIRTEKAFKGDLEFALGGLLMGPLAWDVCLLQKALDSATTNETLLADLLIGRTPSSLALLRAAYAHRSSSHVLSYPSAIPATPSNPAQAQPTRSLDVAVLSAFSSNVRLRKAWEVALQGRWEDEPDEETESDTAHSAEKRVRLLHADVDQLRVALRRGGNSEIVAKILLARSPGHLHELVSEYHKSTGGNCTLSKAIKQGVPVGSLQRLFLHAVEGAKNMSSEFGHGVWRDAKNLDTALGSDKGGQRDELLWRLVRMHWDRPRFLTVQQAFQQKYRFQLSDRLRERLSPGPVAELASALTASASLPEPQPASQVSQSGDDDGQRRLRNPSESSLDSLDGEEEAAAAMSGSGAASVTTAGGARQSGSSDPEAGELEADGELSDPPSPRSPPLLDGGEADQLDDTLDDGDVAVRSTSPRHQRDGSPDIPMLPPSSSNRELARSTSSMSNRSDSSSYRPSSSLSRPRPVEPNGHRPSSSAGGSADSSKLSSSLRHARPVAPGRAKRRSEEAARRAGSEEPLSPTTSAGLRSPTLSGAGSRRTSMSRSTSGRSDQSFASSTETRESGSFSGGQLSRSSSTAPSDMTFGSPQNSIDTTSFFSTPLSPIRDEGPRPSSSFFPMDTPPSATSAPPFDHPDSSGMDIFGTAGATPDSPERFFTSAAMRRQPSSQSSGTSSRPSSLFGEGGLDTLFATGSPVHSRELSLGGEQLQQLVRHAQDLARKLRETEARFQASASAYEQEVSDLEGRLEAARAELQAKRREEKELRSMEREHLQQISSLESDIDKLNKSLEHSREAYENMKRNYTATCEEAERLRALVAETRRENRAAEEAIQSHSLQVQQFDSDRELLQQAIARLEADLADARRAQDSLDNQKQENLLLKETIDKLRFEIEEMRSVGRKSGFLEGPAGSAAFASPSKSLADLDKSLGRELESKAADQNSEASEDEGTAGEEDVDDIIVTTHRRIKKRGKKSGSASQPVVTHVETSVSVCDVDIQTDNVPLREGLVQTDLSAVDDNLVKTSEMEPKIIKIETPPSPPRNERQLQEDLAKNLGIDLGLMKQYVESRKLDAKASTRLPLEGRIPAASGRSRWRSRLPSPLPHAPAYLVNVFPSSARPLVAQVLDSSVSLICYTAAIYLFGMISGSYMLPLTHRHTFVGLDTMLSSSEVAWEGLAVGYGGDSGFAPEGLGQYLYELIFKGVRAARRIPI